MEFEEFEIGKTYKHIDGCKMTIIGEVDTKAYGHILIAEYENGDILPVGIYIKNAVNWSEVVNK